MKRHIWKRRHGTHGRGAIAIAGLGIGTALMFSTGGTAWADDIKADPAAPATGPVAKDGIRTSGIQGELRKSGDQGVIRSSMKAVPATKATAFGDMGDNDYKCRESWDDFC